MNTPHQCPVCYGTGVVSIPPGIPYGQAFSSTSCGPWKCKACNGTGIIWEKETAQDEKEKP